MSDRRTNDELVALLRTQLKYPEIEDALNSLARRLERAVARIEELERLVIAHHAVRDMTVGESCPVCAEARAALREDALTDKRTNEELCDDQCDDDLDEFDCTHCGGDGLCDDGADPLWSCPPEAHFCHACNGSGKRRDQVIF